MEWFINDLSIRGQYPDFQALRDAITPILQLRQRRADLRSRILCSRPLTIRPAIGTVSLERAIATTPDKIFKQLALSWLAKAGPFWDDSRAQNPDDYFHFAGEDVTDQGLGEAARRRIAGEGAATFSLLDPPTNTFQRSPLDVHHGLPEDPIGQIAVINYWSIQDLERAAIIPPGSWGEMLESAGNRMNLLILSDEISAQLRPHPFSRAIAERTLELLEVLQTLAAETLPNGIRTDKGKEIYNSYFIGPSPPFTDESDNNKRGFRSEMTFKDPDARTKSIFCPWHGKVNVEKFRIHFEWPRPIGQSQIKICYIGPKITKA